MTCSNAFVGSTGHPKAGTAKMPSRPHFSEEEEEGTDGSANGDVMSQCVLDHIRLFFLNLLISSIHLSCARWNSAAVCCGSR